MRPDASSQVLRGREPGTSEAKRQRGRKNPGAHGELKISIFGRSSTIICFKNAHVLPCTLRFFRQIIVEPRLKSENWTKFKLSPGATGKNPQRPKDWHRDHRADFIVDHPLEIYTLLPVMATLSSSDIANLAESVLKIASM